MSGTHFRNFLRELISGTHFWNSFPEPIFQGKWVPEPIPGTHFSKKMGSGTHSRNQFFKGNRFRKSGAEVRRNPFSGTHFSDRLSRNPKFKAQLKI
jgi:hypothetical protein